MFVHRRTVVTDYPFIQFMSVVAVPAVYWISCVEIGLLWANGNDNEFSLTFGQVSPASVSIISAPDYLRVDFIRSSLCSHLYLRPSKCSNCLLGSGTGRRHYRGSCGSKRYGANATQDTEKKCHLLPQNPSKRRNKWMITRSTRDKRNPRTLISR